MLKWLIIFKRRTIQTGVVETLSEFHFRSLILSRGDKNNVMLRNCAKFDTCFHVGSNSGVHYPIEYTSSNRSHYRPQPPSLQLASPN